MIEDITKYRNYLKSNNTIPDCIPVELLTKFDNSWELLSLKIDLAKCNVQVKFDTHRSSKDILNELRNCEDNIKSLELTLLYIAKANPILTDKIKGLF